MTPSGPAASVRETALIAFAVAAAGVSAVLVYRYIDIRSFGPFPAMYEPAWYPEKTRSAYAEGAAALASAALVAMLWAHPPRSDGRAGRGDGEAAGRHDDPVQPDMDR